MAEPTEPPFTVQSAINWSLCVLCQEDTGDSLQCPANTRRNDISLGSGYKSLAENILAFCSLGCPPLPIDTSKINEGDGIEATLKRNAAKWHKNCRNKFNSLKLERATKRKRLNECDILIAKRTRNSFGVTQTRSKFDTRCIFCETDSTEALHQVSTFNIDSRVRECALLLDDTRQRKQHYHINKTPCPIARVLQQCKACDPSEV